MAPSRGASALHRLIAFAALSIIAAAQAAHAADPARCRELDRRYETGKPQLTAVEVSLTLFGAADRDCVELAGQLLDQGASGDARDRRGARALSPAAQAGHLQMFDLFLQRIDHLEMSS